MQRMEVGLAAFPNPAIGSTTITFGASGMVRMQLTDGAGRSVRTMAVGELPPGIHQRELDLVGLASGPYVLRVLAESGQGALRVVVP
ncbi:MAG: T9SS type A sorting domain-containing protein [Flavobacteriales bacterium]